MGISMGYPLGIKHGWNNPRTRSSHGEKAGVLKVTAPGTVLKPNIVIIVYTYLNIVYLKLYNSIT
jgi:hypothetical protein